MEGDFDSTSEKVNENHMYIEGFLNRQCAHLCYIYIWIQLLAAELRLAELMKKLNEEEGTISSLNRRIMLLEVSFQLLVFFLIWNCNKVKKERSLTGQKPVMGVTYF